MIIYSGKAKYMTSKELYFRYYFGRLLELLESVDFCRN